MVAASLYIAAGCQLASGPSGVMFSYIQLDEGKRGRTPCAGCGFKSDCKARAVMEPQEKQALGIRDVPQRAYTFKGR